MIVVCLGKQANIDNLGEIGHLIPSVLGQLKHKKLAKPEVGNSRKWPFPIAASPVQLVLFLKSSFLPLSFKVCSEMHKKKKKNCAGGMLVRVKLICTFPGKVIFIRLDCVGHNVLVLNPWLLNK